MSETLQSMNTVYQSQIDLPLVAKGKVRDMYAVGEDKLLIVTTDRLSAFDVVLPDPIPNKGKVLNQLTVFWLEYFKDTISQHLITTDIHAMGLPAWDRPQVHDRPHCCQDESTAANQFL